MAGWNDEDGAVAVFDDLVRGAAEQELGSAAGAAAADDDQRRVELGRGPQQHVDRWPVEHERLDVVALTFEGRAPLEHLARDLAAVGVGRHVLTVDDLGESDGVDDDERPAGAGGLTGRDVQGPLTVLGTVHADDDRMLTGGAHVHIVYPPDPQGQGRTAGQDGRCRVPR